MIIGGKKFDVEHETYVMGILNVTPDSFSDGGKYNGMDQAMEHARQMVEDGADIIDVGGESTRPGHIKITDEEEIARVTPIIEKLKKEFDVPISIDTYKSKVAEAAVQAGADLVNDIWGLKYDEKIADVIAKHNVACCLMHNRDNTEYSNFLDDFMEDMRECIRLAKAAGIADDKIILDPGVGFGKTYEMNLEIIDKLEIMQKLNYPILLGTSRKSVIGLTLDLPVDQREEGTLVTTVYGVQKGSAFVRVHDVKKNKRAIQMVKSHTYKLLERVAEELVEDMLQKFDGLEKVTLEIQKPWAPVGLPLKTVSVRITRSWHTAYIALGSNMGDSRQILDDAVSAIDALPASKVEKVSGFITTPPYGVTDQPDFLNGCLRMKTLYYPKELLRELNRIEKEAGRERIIHWGPRTLDLDIIFYDDLISQEDDLCIPHVEMHKRSFVLEPLEEIAPYKRHPGNGKTVRQMLEELTDS